MKLTDYINSSEELSNSEELVFFGGSFNPWHSGHSSCVQLLPEDKELIVAPDHNPFKEVVDKKYCDLGLIKKELQKSGRPAFIYEGFLAQNKKNPTSVWINELRESFPEKKLSLLIGFDSFASIDRWTSASKLLTELFSLYVASRKDDPQIKEEQTKRVKAIAPDLNLVFLGGHPHEEISSTQIRKKLY